MPECNAHLVAYQDACSRRMTGWSVGLGEKMNLYIEAWEKASFCCRPEEGLIIRSDRGSQYTSIAYRDVLEKHGLQQSMGEAGSCHDNAVAEPSRCGVMPYTFKSSRTTV